MSKAETRRANYRSSVGPIVDLPGELWKPYQDKWEVSNLGRFRTVDREVEASDGRMMRLKARLVEPHCGSVRLCGGGRDAKQRVASLMQIMWEVFIGPLPLGMRVALRNPEESGPITPDRLALYPYTDAGLKYCEGPVVARYKLKRSNPKARIDRGEAAANAARRNLERAREVLMSGDYVNMGRGRSWVKKSSL